jgi:hypothetical protein
LQSADIKYKTFFDKEHRRRGGSSVELSSPVIDRVFEELFVKYKDSFGSRVLNVPEDYPLLKLIKHGITNAGANSKSCDEIMMEYLKDAAPRTNEKFFVFIFKFVVLFRECINRFKKLETSNEQGVEYSEVQGAESAPDLCNEFVTEYMEPNSYFGMNSEEDKYEFIELIQHFCHWLFESGYTSSRLSVLI